MKLKVPLFIAAVLFVGNVHAKTFQNSYLSFEVPDTWTCIQEGVAWTCTPQGALASKEAVIVLASKVAGPEDNLTNFKTFLAQPKRIPSKVGTPMPSQVMYAQERVLDNTRWIQAQHLGSEIQDYYTLYLATVKAQLAILVSFSAEKSRYADYNPVFERAMRTLKIVASQELLFPKKKAGATGSDGFSIQPQAAAPGQQAINPQDLLPPPEKAKQSFGFVHLILLLALIGVGIGLYLSRMGKKKKKSSGGSSGGGGSKPPKSPSGSSSSSSSKPKR